MLAALIGCGREPGVSPGRARLLAAGARPAGFGACLAGVTPGDEEVPVDLAAMARAARAIEVHGASDPCAQARDFALLRASNGDLEGALSRLAEADQATGDPWCEAERAAYLAELGEKNEDPELLLGAVAAADRALILAPTNATALCNRALGLERLALASEARSTWEALRASQPSKPLAALAERHVAVLSVASPLNRWQDLEERLADEPQEVPLRELEEAARQWSRAVRQVGLDALLGRAAEAALDGDFSTADKYVGAAANLGGLLSQLEGDASLALAAGEVRAAIREGAGGRAFLDGVAAYGRGRELRRADRFGESAVELRQAAALTSTHGEAFRAWSRYMAAAATWLTTTTPEERAAIAWQALLRATPEGLPSLRASVAWSAGVAADNAGDLPSALALYDAAVRDFEALGEAESEAAVRAGRAFLLYDLGRDREAGRDLLRALRHRDRVASYGTMEMILDSWIDQVVSPRWPELLILYQDELLAVARASQRPAMLAQAHLVRAENRMAPAADRLEHVTAALDAITSIENPPDRPQLLALLYAARSNALLASDPSGALAAVEAALAEIETHGLEPLRLPALRGKSQALLGMGRFDQAESALLEAVALLYESQGHASTVDERMRTLIDARGIFEDLANVRLAGRNDAAGAFAAIELGRAAAFPVSARGPTPATPTASIDPTSFAAQVPVGTAVVAYAFVGRQLAIWQFDRRGMRSTLLPLDRAEVARLAEELVANLAADREIAADQTAELGRLLLEPIRGWLEPEGTVLVLPDAVLAAVPWGALIDPATGAPLLSDHAVLTAPSARWVNGAASWRLAEARPQSVRALGNPAFGRQWFPTLAALPEAAAEADAVAVLYPRAEILLAGSATARAALRPPLPDVIHVATHGLIPSNAPERPALVMAPDDEHLDGLLAAPEIAAHSLDGVQLVVLPACASAGGIAHSGEGILSLATAFLAAGVPAVVATYWPVEDAAARKIMVAFHQGVVAGLAPARALRHAQLATMETPNSRPSMWAAFGVWGVR